MRLTGRAGEVPTAVVWKWLRTPVYAAVVCGSVDVKGVSEAKT